jgi:hypothetical protein
MSNPITDREVYELSLMQNSGGLGLDPRIPGNLRLIEAAKANQIFAKQANQHLRTARQKANTVGTVGEVFVLLRNLLGGNTDVARMIAKTWRSWRNAWRTTMRWVVYNDYLARLNTARNLDIIYSMFPGPSERRINSVVPPVFHLPDQGPFFDR